MFLFRFYLSSISFVNCEDTIKPLQTAVSPYTPNKPVPSCGTCEAKNNYMYVVVIST